MYTKKVGILQSEIKFSPARLGKEILEYFSGKKWVELKIA